MLAGRMFSPVSIDDQNGFLVAIQFNGICIDRDVGSTIGIFNQYGIGSETDLFSMTQINIGWFTIDKVDNPKMTFECPLVFLVAFVFIG